MSRIDLHRAASRTEAAADPWTGGPAASGTALAGDEASSVEASPATLDAADGASPPSSGSHAAVEPAELAWERLPPFPAPWRHPLRALAWLIRAAFGLASLILLLAVLAAIPIVNFLALGYLLDAEGRVARTGRLRQGAPLFNLAPRFGGLALGVWLWLWPLRLLSSISADAQLIDPAGAAARRMPLILTIAWLAITLHLCLALARGGAWGTYFRPIKNFRWLLGNLRRQEYWTYASASIRRFLARLELRRCFLLGWQGFAATFAWLLVPTALFAIMRDTRPAQGLLTVLGGLWLAWAFSWAPFLQARLAAEQRWRSGLAIGEVRRLWGHAPIAWLLATIAVCVLSLPLYLFKVVLPPSDAMWGVTLVFIASIYPARLLTGWAYARAVQNRLRGQRSHWLLRTGCRLLALAIVLAYVFVLFFTQFIGAHGKRTLFEHHALLLPWPA